MMIDRILIHHFFAGKSLGSKLDESSLKEASGISFVKLVPLVLNEVPGHFPTNAGVCGTSHHETSILEADMTVV